MTDDDLQIRQATADDLPQILEVLQSSLGSAARSGHRASVGMRNGPCGGSAGEPP